MLTCVNSIAKTGVDTAENGPLTGLKTPALKRPCWWYIPPRRSGRSTAPKQPAAQPALQLFRRSRRRDGSATPRAAGNPGGLLLNPSIKQLHSEACISKCWDILTILSFKYNSITSRNFNVVLIIVVGMSASEKLNEIIWNYRVYDMIFFFSSVSWPNSYRSISYRRILNSLAPCFWIPLIFL